MHQVTKQKRSKSKKWQHAVIGLIGTSFVSASFYLTVSSLAITDHSIVLDRSNELRDFGANPALSVKDKVVRPQVHPKVNEEKNVRPLAPRNRKMFPAWKEGASTMDTSQSPNGGAFIHMGKTGGSTISVLLRNGCHSFMPHPCRTVENETAASRFIESYYHVPDFPFLKVSHHDFYLLTLRDPFDRTVSAFCFEHLLNRYARNETVDKFKTRKYEDAYTCFPTLQSYVDYLGDNPRQFSYPYKQNMVISDSCSDLAKAAFAGKVKLYNHFFFSFQRILSFIPNVQQQTVYAVRQEQLWPDWKSVNQALGQTSSIHIQLDKGIRNTTAFELNHKLPVARELSIGGAARLCNALQDEYRAYYFFLQRARNLSPDDLALSIARTKRNCPHLETNSLLRYTPELVADVNH